MKTKTSLFAVFNGDLERNIMGDISALYAVRPMIRFSFEMEESAIPLLMERLPERVFRAFRWQDESGTSWTELMLRFDETSFVHVTNHYCKRAHVYAESEGRAREVEALVRAALPAKDKKKDLPFFYMLRRDSDEFSTEEIVNSAPVMDDEEMTLCYGADALSWLDEFAQRTVEKSGGITILDGPPGTGKSTLISLMMHRLAKTHVFYTLPVGQQESLSAPGMVAFWQSQNGRHPKAVKVIVMEDAEKILFQRRSDNNEAVSALLNIADGLMGQMLRVHVLCSLNQGMEHLDPAIVRPGRLRSYRHVGLLSRSQAERLAAKKELPFRADPKRESYTLAEVFHEKAYEAKARKKMGFGALIESEPKVL